MTKAQIIYDMPSHEYHAVDAISKSGMTHLKKSPAHYKYWLENREDDTDALRFGRAFHTMVLEPQKFDVECAVAPECDKRSLANKAIHADFAIANAGKTIISRQELSQIRAMADSIHAHPSFTYLLGKAGKAEVSIFVEDEDTWAKCKTRLDYVTDSHIIIELKSCRDASHEGFTRDAFNYGYHTGAAMQMDFYEAATGIKPSAYIFACVEKDAPFAAAIYTADADFIRAGRIEYKRLVKVYASACASEKWSAYPSEIMQLGSPQYIQRKLDNGELE